MPGQAFLRTLRDRVESASGWRIRAEFPFGNEKFRDLRRAFPELRLGTILDVGANIGQSALLYHKEFPQATIHCFEPVGGTAEQLIQNTAGHTGIHVHRMALGAETSTMRMQVGTDGASSDMNSLKGVHPHLAGASFQTEEVQITTLDNWCNEHKVQAVDFLKIDTEGFDLEVLKGAATSLAKGAIRLIDIEVGMNPTNLFHAPFMEVSTFLWGKGFLTFGIYDQLPEPSGLHLRRVNVLFVAASMAKITSNPC